MGQRLCNVGVDARSNKHQRQFTEVDDAHKTH